MRANHRPAISKSLHQRNQFELVNQMAIQKFQTLERKKIKIICFWVFFYWIIWIINVWRLILHELLSFYVHENFEVFLMHIYYFQNKRGVFVNHILRLKFSFILFLIAFFVIFWRKEHKKLYLIFIECEGLFQFFHFLFVGGVDNTHRIFCFI